MKKNYFIAGTDTDCGKTLVTETLLLKAKEKGLRTVGLKPIASGAEHTPDGLRNEDALALAAESSVRLPYALTNPLCFEPAVAPHIAAAEAGIAIAVPDLAAWYTRATAQADLAIVEGAGGWRVPLHPEGFLSDLPEQLGLDVLLVVGLRLGCLSHARLTLEAIERSGRCRYVGWIGNCIDPAFARLDQNLVTLARLLGGPPLAVIPPLADATAAAAIEHLNHPALARILGLST